MGIGQISKFHRKAIAALLAAVVVTAFGFQWRGQSAGPTTAPIEKKPIVESVYGIGTLTAQRSLPIKVGTTTTVSKLYVKEGDQVSKGQRLFELDGVPFRAPFTGVVTSAPLREGENVFPQTVIATLVDLADSYLLVSLEQPAMLKVKAGLPAQVSFDGIRDRTFSGRVDSVYSNGVDFLARISVKDLPTPIVPGMTADVAIVLQEKQDALLAPVAALSGGSLSVLRSGRELKVPVKVGLNDGARVEILSGELREGDLALIAGANKK